MIVITDPPIDTGPTGDLTSWYGQVGGGTQLLPITQTIQGGAIRLRGTAWGGPPPIDSLTYLGPPPDYTATNGAILQPFSLPVPYP